MINDFPPSYASAIPMQIRVLHVDDDQADLDMTRIFLIRVAKEDFEISGVLSAEEALAKLEREHFDVIIADYTMPGMDGIEFLEVLRKSENHTEHTPFILFTGQERPDVAKEALNKGADRYITKNGNPASRCSALARAIYELAQEKNKNAVNAVNSHDTMLLAGLVK